MRLFRLLSFASTAAVLTSLACKLPVAGEGENKTDPANGTGPTKNWAFTMALSKNNFTIQTGSTDTTIVTFTRTGGFTGPVTIDAVYKNGPDSGVITTSEPITTTGAVTTSRLMTRVLGGHFAVSNFTVNLHSGASNPDEVEGQFADFVYNIVRKPGTFINVPTALSVGRGQSLQQRVSITRTDYTAAVPFNLVLFNNAPAGITATFNPNPVTDTVTQMVISVDASVPEGSYSIGVRDNEGTSFQGTAPVTLTVTAPGSFTFSPTLATLALPRNTTVPDGFSITRTNYTGPLTIAVTGLPAGVTAGFVNPVTTNNFSISFTNSGSGTPGAYQITVTLSGQGVTPVSVVMTLNVS